MAKIVGQESPSKNTQILYRRSRKVSNAISTAVNIYSSRNHRARFALDRKIRCDNKRLGRSTIMVDDHRVTLNCNVNYVSIPTEKRQKLDDKARKLVFVGYEKGTKGYRLL